MLLISIGVTAMIAITVTITITVRVERRRRRSRTLLHHKPNSLMENSPFSCRITSQKW